MNSARLLRAHLAIVLSIKLETAAALLADTELFPNSEDTLDNWFLCSLSRIQNTSARTAISECLEYFFQSCVRQPIGDDHLAYIAHKYSSLYSVLRKWDFIPSTQIPPLSVDATSLPDSLQHLPFCYTPVVYISFASYQWLAPYIFYRYLLAPGDPHLCFFISSNLDHSVSEFNDLITDCPLFRCVDCSGPIRLADLHMLHNSGSTERAIQHCQKLLYSRLGLESTYYFSDHRFNPTISTIASKCYQNYFLKRSQLVWHKQHRISFSQPSSLPNLLQILNSHRPIIGVANRDTLWAGPSQPWRDTPIENFQPSIHWLLSQGYSVIRLNLISEPLCFSHPNLYDLSGLELSFREQMYIYSRLAACISCSSGIVGWPITFFSIPTLIIDSSVAYFDGTYTDWAISTKTIFVSDPFTFAQVPWHHLIHILFMDIWSYDNLSGTGLGVTRLDPVQILQETKDMLMSQHTYENPSYISTHKLFSKYRIVPSIFNQYLTPRAAKNLEDIIQAHRRLNQLPVPSNG